MLTPQEKNLLPSLLQRHFASDCVDFAKIKSTIKGFRIVGEELYQWENHLVIYGLMNQPERTKRKLALAFPELEIKIPADRNLKRVPFLQNRLPLG